MQKNVECNKQDVGNNRMIAVLAYLGVLAAVLLISWRLYFIVRIVGYMAWVFPVLALIGIMNVVNGQEKELPVIGKIRVVR